LPQGGEEKKIVQEGKTEEKEGLGGKNGINSRARGGKKKGNCRGKDGAENQHPTKRGGKDRVKIKKKKKKGKFAQLKVPAKGRRGVGVNRIGMGERKS